MWGTVANGNFKEGRYVAPILGLSPILYHILNFLLQVSFFFLFELLLVCVQCLLLLWREFSQKIANVRRFVHEVEQLVTVCHFVQSYTHTYIHHNNMLFHHCETKEHRTHEEKHDNEQKYKNKRDLHIRFCFVALGTTKAPGLPPLALLLLLLFLASNL